MTRFYDTIPEIYVSIVVETNGPIPGAYSMIELGAVALNKSGEEVSSFDTALTPVPGSNWDSKTMKHWLCNDENKKLLLAMKERAVEPIDAISSFTSWARSLNGPPVLAAYDSARVWMWIHWYITSYMTKSPFSYTSLDIKTLASYFMERDFLSFGKGDLPQDWRVEMDAPDTALTKARKQAHILKWILKARKELYATFDIPRWVEENYGCSITKTKREQRRRSVQMAGKP